MPAVPVMDRIGIGLCRPEKEEKQIGIIRRRCRHMVGVCRR